MIKSIITPWLAAVTTIVLWHGTLLLYESKAANVWDAYVMTGLWVGIASGLLFAVGFVQALLCEFAPKLYQPRPMRVLLITVTALAGTLPIILAAEGISHIDKRIQWLAPGLTVFIAVATVAIGKQIAANKRVVRTGDPRTAHQSAHP